MRFVSPSQELVALLSFLRDTRAESAQFTVAITDADLTRAKDHLAKARAMATQAGEEARLAVAAVAALSKQLVAALKDFSHW